MKQKKIYLVLAMLGILFLSGLLPGITVASADDDFRISRMGWRRFRNPDGNVIFKDRILYQAVRCRHSGRLRKITINYMSYTSNVKTKCALYDRNGNLIAETEERILPDTNGEYQRETFRFTRCKPFVKSRQRYILAVWGDNNGRLAYQERDCRTKRWYDMEYGEFPEVLGETNSDTGKVFHIFGTIISRCDD